MSEWISLKKERPGDEHDGRYLIIYTWSSARLNFIVEADIWLGSQFEFWGDKVSHWMLLPEPPDA
ncbi:TPA: DUF551 domain-containing protein [Pseudomonas aeruginosa]|uniref:DUF551 domain-containing protein n=5 Tax=Caudoviricetes TaxID=2731619 RepID=A0AAF0DPX3_9CAUD|nr:MULTISPECIES: DUF551 domain-containing protein [Pseudomonas]YP_009187404.1 DUF551 domain-containing protein [Pseudomonas phage YMC11/02/R656]YP_009291075.1 DUF551 domain-containing protein [Pseudomonas phage phiMK]YP_010762114.1 DUF551 domain-containing protein [Pseudomonas phage PaGz-1]YP_010762183.1 hypothetical protein QE323_gp119 [Pseudomonas phage SPA05]YP_010762836.1 DUF551 domain-containing protein [Pseudomonas phage PaZq-1]QAY01624.1 hypothetical protein PaSzw1_61 [Pseudomonas phag